MRVWMWVPTILAGSAFFTSLSTQKSNRYLDQVSLDNLNNGGNAERGFLRLDFQVGTGDFLRVGFMGGCSSFQLANLRSQHANAQNQRQLLKDGSISFGYVHVIGSSATIDSTNSYRASIAQLLPSAGDTPVTAAQARHLANLTSANRFNLIGGRHELRMGFDYQHFPVSEHFSFGITDALFNMPTGDNCIPSLLQFDLGREAGSSSSPTSKRAISLPALYRIGCASGGCC